MAILFIERREGIEVSQEDNIIAFHDNRYHLMLVNYPKERFIFGEVRSEIQSRLEL